MTLQTCNQSDEETWPDQQKDNDKYNDILRTSSKSNPWDFWAWDIWSGDIAWLTNYKDNFCWEIFGFWGTNRIFSEKSRIFEKKMDFRKNLEFSGKVWIFREKFRFAFFFWFSDFFIFGENKIIFWNFGFFGLFAVMRKQCGQTFQPSSTFSHIGRKQGQKEEMKPWKKWIRQWSSRCRCWW